MYSLFNGLCCIVLQVRKIIVSMMRGNDLFGDKSFCMYAGIVILFLGVCWIPGTASARTPHPQAWFVDGYHGGIYGHYPVEWKTRFIVDQLETHPEWRIGLEIEPETWDTVQLRTMKDYTRFKRISTDHRVEFTNPTYAQPYCYNISGESIVRQFVYGMRKLCSHFPGVEFVTYAVEEPCFTSSLPQILRSLGFRYASLKCPNTCWGGYMAPYGGETVEWTGPDGTSIRTVPRYASEYLQRNSVWQTTAWGNDTTYLNACFRQGIAHPVGMCYQDAGWKFGPWIGSGDSIRNGSRYVTWREYFEQVADSTAGPVYRLSQEDVRVSLVWGSQILQRIARQVRRAENHIIQAEKTAVMNHLLGTGRYDSVALDEAWRTLMLAQHHDSWIVPYNDLHGNGTWADHIHRWTAATDSISQRVIAEAANGLGQDIESKFPNLLRVINTLGVARQEPVWIQLPAEFGPALPEIRDVAGRRLKGICYEPAGNGYRLAFEAEVPAFGYADYRLTPGKHTDRNVSTPAKMLNSGRYVLENDMYRIVLNLSNGGVIESLLAKKCGNREFVDLREGFFMGELRGCFYDEGGIRSSTEMPAKLTVLRNDELEQSVRIEGRIASHPFAQILTIRRGERRIDFDLTIDWQGNTGIGAYKQTDAYASNQRAFYDDRSKLRVCFPIPFASARISKDAPFDVCESQLSDTYFTTWDSIKHNILLHWVDLSASDGRYGLTLMADHTTSYSYGPGDPLALTVQYSGNGLWGRDYSLDGPTHLRYAVVPHRGVWSEADIDCESRKWNEPLLCSLHSDDTPRSISLLDLGESGYELSAVYMDRGQILLRLFNAAGTDRSCRLRFALPLSQIEEVSLDGDLLASVPSLVKNGQTDFEVAMPRFGLRTFRLTK